MELRHRGSLSFLIGALAAVGVLASHVAAYVLVAPQAHERNLLLEATGHSYLHLVSAAALGAFVAALVRYVVSAQRAEHGGRFGGSKVSGLWIRLIVLQVLGFIAMEGIERLIAAGSFEHLLAEPAVLLGIGLQSLVALVGALLLVWFRRVVEVVLGHRSGVGADATPIPQIWIEYLLPARVALTRGERTLRGPPAIA
jgi:hypothetical protein